MSTEEFEFNCHAGDSSVWLSLEIARYLVAQEDVIGDGYRLWVWRFGPTELPYTFRDGERVEYRTRDKDRAHDWIFRAAMAGYNVRRGTIGASVSGLRRAMRRIAERKKEYEAMQRKEKRQMHFPKRVAVRQRVEGTSRDVPSEAPRAEPEQSNPPQAVDEGYAARRKTVLGVFAESAAKIFKPISDAEFDAARDAAMFEKK